MDGSIHIKLNAEQQKYLKDFIEQQEKVAKEREQKRSDLGYKPLLPVCAPYGGAIGGDVTYEITPTGLGPIIKVRYLMTGSVLDLTDFDR